jgi:hypothetical protein
VINPKNKTSKLRIFFGTLALPALALSAAAWAANYQPLNIKPGEWELTTTGLLYGQTIPPETHRDCVTAEEIEDTNWFKKQQEENKRCKLTLTESTPQSLVYTRSCNGTGEIRVSVTSPQQYTQEIKGSGPTQLKTSYKWLSATCTVKN